MSLYHTRHVWPLVLPPPLKLVLLALADAADPETHECWPGIAYLQRRTGYSDRQLRRHIRELVATGLIEIRATSKRGRPTRYRVTLNPPDLQDEVAEPASPMPGEPSCCLLTDERPSCPPMAQSFADERSSCPPIVEQIADGRLCCPPMDHLTGQHNRSRWHHNPNGRSFAMPWAVISSPGLYNDARVDPVLDPIEIQNPPISPPTGGTYPYEFEYYFWGIYPHPVGKGAALRAFRQLHLTLPQLVAMREAVLAHRAYNPRWRPDADGRVFIPNPATWLRQRRFDDPLPGPKRATSKPLCPHPAAQMAQGRSGEWHCFSCGRELSPEVAEHRGLSNAPDERAREALDEIFAVLGRR
jgi:hypothetical protein